LKNYSTYILLLFLLLTFTRLAAQVPGVDMNMPGVGIVGDSSSQQGEVINENVKIDPFVATFKGIEGAGLRYDSATWSLEGLQNFHPVFSYDFAMQTTGDPGMPAIARHLNKQFNPGFQNGYQLYEAYLLTHQNSPYYRAFTPFTKLDYVQTQRDYVHLKGFHTQNITPGWNFGIRFQTINNAGLYPRNRNSMRQAGVFSRYMGLKNRYYAQLTLQINKVSSEESGGWMNDLDFDNLTGTNKSAEVKLNNSTNVFSHREHAYEQVYWFSGSVEQTTDTTQFFVPKWGIKQKTILAKTYNRMRASGADFQFLPGVLQDSMQTNDSSAFVKQTHSLGIVSHLTDSSNFYIYAGMGAELLNVNYAQYQKIRPGNNLFVEASMFAKKEFLKLEADFRYDLAGFNANDLYLLSTLLGTWNKNKPENNIYFSTHLHHRTPAFIYHQFYSNHLQWNNNLVKETYLQLSLGTQIKHKIGQHRVHLKNHTVNNPVFVDFNRQATQFNGNLNLSEISIESKFNIKKIHSVNKVRMLQPSNLQNAQILPTPKYASYHSIFYENSLFKSALTFQIGADVMWFSEYYGNAYDPVSRLFYLQNTRKQGNYPFLNGFANIQIKTFRAFVKIEHASFELFEDQAPNLFYSTLGFPVATRRIVFGISWKFYQ